MNGHTLAPGVMNHAGTMSLLGRLLDGVGPAIVKALATIALCVPLGLIVLLGVLTIVGVLSSLATPAKED